MPAVVRLLQSHRSVAGIGQSWPTASAISSSGIGNGQLTRPHYRHTLQTLPPLSLPRTAITTRSGGRQPAVAVATHGQRKANSLRMTSVVIRSGGREPAVVLHKTDLAGQRRTRNGKHAIVFATAGLRQPLLVARTHTAVDARLRPATALCFPRLAHTSRSWFVSREPCSMCVSQCHQTKSMSKQASVGSRAIGAFLSRGCAVHTTVGLRRFLGQPG